MTEKEKREYGTKNKFNTSEIDILTKLDAISVIKENKTEVDYFLFNEFEVHLNRIPPKSTQEWHIHNIIEEVIVVTKGKICVKWKERNEIKSRNITKGEIVRVKKSIHTFENNTEDYGEFTVFRMIPNGADKREIIKNDKIIISDI